MDSFVIPMEVLMAADEKYKGILAYHELGREDGHLPALRVAIHEALLKEAELGLITFTEKSVHWVPAKADELA